ncbi:MAG: DUF1294 domain-containing protein [Clostridia bacterium]|nr:DUF1294 domain-containing protein [Clostridia bacterium]
MGDTVIDYILIYLAVISIISVIVCISDKRRAIKNQRRISEKALFTLGLLGGATALYITMVTIRHKTLHKRFMIGLPVIIILQCVLLFLVVDKLNI